MIQKLPTASTSNIKTSQPKLAKLLPVQQSLKDVDLFGEKPSSSSPRQPVRKAHNPKLPLIKPKDLHKKTSSIDVKSASVNAHSDQTYTIPRKTAETTLDCSG